ncbi:MAG: hypothetical protein CL558_01495 [Alphaproteobacteria bacterium]|nr:hypothetical protein [Alphaproteobacteria bacterium]MAX96666.1 hypothetical protein [Alphaproteobacteria bacterium]MBN52231.1 hypothetical protein [Alphaproteobacteria bacterium]|tara:strand:- start:13518 stop:15215 length:1698 start_codon:yes stop_codon:yes gene_type:complete
MNEMSVPPGPDFLTGNTVEPVITAAETYAMVEAAIMDAQDTVFMAYWTFDPRMKTVRDDAEQNWASLIDQTIRRGINIRILLADFDPILGYREHHEAWRNFRHLHHIKNQLPPEDRDRLQILCSRHDARVGTTVSTLFQPLLCHRLTRLIESEKDADEFQDAPGLWGHLDRNDDGDFSERISEWLTTYPAAHHEKLCVIDDRVAFVGGLDLNRRRLDDIQHSDPQPWHDVACRLEGPIAAYFGQHFRGRWNRERDDILKRLDEVIEHGKRLGLDTDVPDTQRHTDPIPTGTTDKDEGLALTDIEKWLHQQEAPIVVPLRTVSKQSKSSFSRTPVSADHSFFSAYKAIIAKAQDTIYVETQFLRSTPIVDALIEQKKAEAGLQLIVLLPLLPERMINDEEPNPATRHGHHLQKTAIKRLEKAYGEDFGSFTLMRALPNPVYGIDHPKSLNHNHIYIHAKTMVVDDRYAIIGSANLNGRSMLTDTETGVLWHDPEGVRAYRIRLWQHALGSWPDDQPAIKALDYWHRTANTNACGGGVPSEGFVVPLLAAALDHYAEASLLVPEELV